jgi:hypothetical protein
MKIAVMQPYFAPYMGYFQLINEVDKFVFLEDVNFIKGGWINRNVITLNNQPHRFSIPLKGASSFRKINEVEINWDCRNMGKLKKTLRQRFSKGSVARRIVDTVFAPRPRTISELAIASIRNISEHLGIETSFGSSSAYDVGRSKDSTTFLVDVCRLENADTFVNSIGGQHLYCKAKFADHAVELKFIEGQPSQSLLEVIDTKQRQVVIDDLRNVRLV